MASVFKGTGGLWIALLILAGSLALLGCDDEDKTGCRTDGECAGLRVCRNGTCELPSEFGDGGLQGPESTQTADSGVDDVDMP